ncbi:dienelactone hydrolase [Bradyrhizobium sp. AZCC 1610]|uniref:dienelactone hydrolase family protein n=1 Tax=Bradyrhizobium sp. AZCC 1610 TaxID=3117020 RepID=UPI002FEFCF34
MKSPLLIALPIVLFIGAQAQAQLARQEFHALQSITLSDADFLNGKKDGVPVTLAGVLRLPKLGPEKLPAAILLQGSGGVGGSGSMIDEWTRELNEIGIATFAVDSFSGRGIIETVTDQTRLGRLSMIVDAYRALELVSKHRQIDPVRVAVMGFSRGGQSALYSSVVRFRKMHGPPGELNFAAHIAMYPTCNTTFRDDDDVVARPIRLLHGTADDYAPIAPCRAYVERLSKAGKDIRLVEYPDAHHVFDAPAFREPRKLAAAATVRRCLMAEADNGVILNQETKQPFSYGDACVEKGPTVAFNEVASAQARAFVRDFLKEVFASK